MQLETIVRLLLVLLVGTFRLLLIDTLLSVSFLGELVFWLPTLVQLNRELLARIARFLLLERVAWGWKKYV